jgi:membrane protease YdiL (CAAX protease family)
MGLMCLYELAAYAMDPQSFRLTPDIGRSLLFLPIALLLVPLQSAFEEVATRGQLMQGLIRLAPAKPYLALLLTSGIFAAMHLMNTEVQAYGAGLMLLHYFTFGAVLGAFALMDEGLELSIGIHAGNNLFSLCLVSYPESSLETPALLHQQAMSEGMDFLFMLLCVGVMYAVFFGRRPQAWRVVLENLRTGSAEPQDSPEKAG